jgi:outer membrane protein assembly factor BamB
MGAPAARVPRLSGRFVAVARRPRSLATGLVVLALLAAAAVVGYRVLAPAETLTPATGPYPAEPAMAGPVRYGALTGAPLILDRRLRVFAEPRRVWADTPVTAKVQLTPYWAYRRWPASVNGIVAVEPAGGRPPLVLTRWSDGVLVAVDAARGRILWRTRIAAPTLGGYDGRRTGSRTTYEPVGLYTARSVVDDRSVVLASDAGRVWAYDPWSGATRWTRPAGPRCRTGPSPPSGGGDRSPGGATDWTGPTTYVTRVGCGDPAIEVVDAGTGRTLASWRPPGVVGARPSPWGCALGRSGCELVRFTAPGFGDGSGTAGGTWRIGADGTITREPVDPAPDAVLVGDAIVEGRTDAYVRIVDRASGAQRWRTAISGSLAGADESGVYVLTRRDTLQIIDASSGVTRGEISLRGKTERGPWHGAWHVYVHAGFVAVERLGPGTERDGDDEYFYGKMPVVLVGT